MDENMGYVDRTLRRLVGVALLGLTFAGQIGLWGLIGLLPLATSRFTHCPLYRMLGINTCSSSR
jgi:hypothetical protein